MVQVTYPGVYIEEVSSGVHTITGVSTSIAAFFGRTRKGPLNKAVRILSLSDFQRQFGGAHPHSDLADSVTQFFVNGGTDCYVVRLAKGARKAQVTLRDIEGENVLDAIAKAEGVWANTVRLEVDYNTANSDDTFNLTVIQEDGGVVVASENFTGLSMDPTSPRYAPTLVSQSSELIDLKLFTALLAPALTEPPLPTSFINNIANSVAGFSQSRRPLGATAPEVQTTLEDLITMAAPTGPQFKFNISVNGSPPAMIDLKDIFPLPAGLTLTDALSARITTALGPVSPGTTVAVSLDNVASVGILMTITSNSGDQSRVQVTRSASNDIAAALMLGVGQGGVEITRYSNFRPAPTATILTLGPVATPRSVDNVNNLATLLQNEIIQLTIDGTNIALNAGDLNLVTTVATDSWLKYKVGDSPITGDNDGVREKLQIIAHAINASASLPWRAEVWGYHLALRAKSGTTPNATPVKVETTVADFDNAVLKNVHQYTLGASGTGAFSTAGFDGNDGIAPTETEYLGTDVDQTGFHALDPVDLVNLMVLPADDEVSETTLFNLWGPASDYCQTRRAFLIIDAPPSWTKNARPRVVSTTSLVNDLRVRVNKQYSAVFYPRIRYRRLGVTRLTGPSGAIAGLMARTDSTRGVWKAPAGLEADIRNVLGLEVNLTDAENGVLNKLGVNCLRIFPNGIVNWGARTMAGSDDLGSEWKYIPIRRLALFLEESLYRGTQWVVFEPNDEPLWANIRLNTNAFMMGLFRQGAFQGTTPDKAFFVKCDAETTTQADRNLGIVNIIVGFAPLKPAEFVIIKIQQIAGDLT